MQSQLPDTTRPLRRECREVLAAREVPFSSTFEATFGAGGLSIGSTLTDSYTRYSFVTTALGSLTRLSFTTNPDPQGSTTDTYFLDDVSVTDLSAPEIHSSQSALPLGLAIGMLLLVRSRRCAG